MTLYTDDDVQAIQDSFDEWLHRMHGITSSCRHEVEARAILDALAPAIVARALRQEAEFVADLRHCTAEEAAAYLTERADEIEAAS